MSSTEFKHLIAVRIVTVLYLISVSIPQAYTQTYHFKNYTIDDGLGQSQVSAVFQDHAGVIWMGSNGGGVTTFDGQTFTVYTTENGLADNVVNEIYEDDKQQIWICTAGGVSRWMPHATAGGSSLFVNFTVDDGLADDKVWAVIQDRQGRMIFGTNEGISILLLSGETAEGARFSNSKLGLSHNIVRSILQDDKGVFWYGTENGLTRHDPSAAGEVFSYYSSKDGLADDFIWSSLEDAEGNLWFGTGRGISRYRKNRVPAGEQKFESILKVNGIQLNIIYDIRQDRQGNIWFAGWGGVGAIEYVPKFNVFRRISKSNGLADNNVISILEDNEGNLWFGTYGHGVSKFIDKRFENYTREEGLPDNFIWAVKEDMNQNIWLGGNLGGATRIVREKNEESFSGYFNTVQHFAPENGFISKQVTSIAIDRSGDTWFCTQAGLASLKMPAPLFAPDGKSVPRLAFQQFTMSSGLMKERPRILYEDSRKNFWIGYDGGGLQKMTMVSGLPVFYKDTYHSELLNNFTLYAIHEDRRGDIWFGTAAGIVKFSVDDSTGSVTQEINITTEEGLVDNEVRAIVEDSDGNLWFGTGGGLSKFNPYQPGKKFENYTSHDGLWSDRISLLQFDNMNNLWIGTNVGLDVLDFEKYKSTTQKFDPVEYKYKSSGEVEFRHFGYAEGFLGSEANTGASCKDAAGSLWFGTIHGLIRYNPGEDAINKVAPITRIVGVDLFSNAVDLATPMKFQHDQNHITFRFLGISHKLQEGVTYKYKLDGFAYNWSAPSTSTTVTFANLPVGSYKFEVLAGNSDGVWIEEPATYSFEIVPPFWRSVWFYLLVITGLGGLIYTIVKIRLRALEQTARALSEQVEIKTARLKASERQYRTLFDSSGDSIFIYDRDTYQFLDCNETAVEVYGYSKEEIRKMKPNDFHPHEDPEKVRKIIENKSETAQIYEHYTKDGRKLYVEVKSSELIFDQKAAVLSIVRDITARMEDAQKIESINKQLTGSIRYSKRILDAILRSKSDLAAVHPDSFILFKPKDIVSGDFYWFHKVDGKAIVAVIDCTGHGVAGAFMSLIGNEILDDVVKNKKILDPGRILSEMHKAVVATLKKGESLGESVGGMDVALCCLDYEHELLEFAGAGRPLVILRDGVEMVYSGNKYPVGLVLTPDGKYSNVYMNERKNANGVIKSEKIRVHAGDSIYLFTDGYCDQFGGDSGEKFMRERFSELLSGIQGEDMRIQEKILTDTMTKWQGDHPQVDDMLIIGLKV